VETITPRSPSSRARRHHAGGAERGAAEAADQVDADHPLEGGDVVGRISPVSRARLTVFWPIAMPAQLTRMRSWPWAARPGRSRGDAFVGGHVHGAEDAADLARHLLSALGVHVEHGHLDALRRKGPGRGLAQAAGRSGDDGGNVGRQTHELAPWVNQTVAVRV
jgi:hypothetical protein